jgi:hypothetical protein
MADGLREWQTASQKGDCSGRCDHSPFHSLPERARRAVAGGLVDGRATTLVTAVCVVRAPSSRLSECIRGGLLQRALKLRYKLRVSCV